MLRWIKSLRAGATGRADEIPDTLWQATLDTLPFLQQLDADELLRLRRLCREFLDDKEFHGAQGLVVTDAMALAIAAQACLPVLHIDAPYRGLEWYGDFVGIVVHADAVRARRETVDEIGIVHEYDEVLSGEAMEHGPVMLSWKDVADAADSAADGYNVVVHEFVHKIDMRDGAPDGCPPLPSGFLGSTSGQQARARWLAEMERHYVAFCDQLSLAERFGAAAPWLDGYAGESIDEFFAVACEAYFVNRARFRADFAGLVPLFDAFFRPRRPAD